AAEPTLAVKANALDALESASLAGEFYYHVTVGGFGPYVDQIGRYPAGGSSGWVFKVNGLSPPVGADAVVLKPGDRVLWYWATFGPSGGPRLVELGSRDRLGDARSRCACAPRGERSGRPDGGPGARACREGRNALRRAVHSLGRRRRGAGTARVVLLRERLSRRPKRGGVPAPCGRCRVVGLPLVEEPRAGSRG